jgi:hypothetical protein
VAFGQLLASARANGMRVHRTELADEPGGTDDLAEEPDDLAEYRADATRRFLDE